MARYHRQSLAELRTLPWLAFVRYEQALERHAKADIERVKREAQRNPQGRQRR